MEVLLQVMEDRNYLDAQAHSPIRYNLDSLQHLTSHAQAAKTVAECGLSSILDSYVLRSIFRQYLASEKKGHVLLAFEELSHVVTIPSPALRGKQLVRFWHRYISPSCRNYIPEIGEEFATLPAFEEAMDTQDETTREERFKRMIGQLETAIAAEIPSYASSKFGFYHANYAEHSVKTLSTKEYEKLRKLGEGGFGKVHAIKRTATGALYAVKEMSIIRIIKKKRMDTVVNEARILRGNQHPFLLNLHHCFADELNIYITIDLMTGGELKFHLARGVEPTKAVAQFWIASLVLGIEWLHNKDIIHRDLKPANVLLDKDGFIKIADFGLSLDLTLHKRLPSSCCGTPGYIAPEMYLGPSWDRKKQGTSQKSTTDRQRPTLRNSTKFFTKTRNKLFPQETVMSYVSRSIKQDSTRKRTSKGVDVKPNEPDADSKFPRYKNYGKAVDWYSVGVICHQVYCFGTFPFTRGPDRTEKHQIQENIAGNIRWRDLRAPYNGEENEHLSDIAKDLIRKLLHHAPTERLGGEEGAEEIKVHPFFQGVQWEKLSKKLVVPPFIPDLQSVNAEFQDSGEEPNEKKDKKEIKRLLTPEIVNSLEKLTYTRQQTLTDELQGAEIVYGEETTHRKVQPNCHCAIS